MTKRHVSVPADADAGYDEFVDEVDRRLSSSEDTSEVVAEVLAALNGDRDAYERWRGGGDVSPGERVRLQSYDPRNATLESEYYAELAVREEQWAESKPLQWLWRQFDDTPAADNVEFALRFRRMLGKHLFADCGDDCRFFRGISMTYGHNVEIGDNVVIHDDVHLDDRGKLTVGDRASISEGAHLYSHDHDVVDQTDVTNYRTVVGDDARVTYDAMVRAGCKVGENALVGARAVVQSDVPAHHVAVGMPVESVAVKPGFEAVAEPVEDAQVDRRDQRLVEYDFADADFETFDEFQRDRQPPGEQ
jgi:acetyltransferase-like isoleucine patch superfamily enzyme